MAKISCVGLKSEGIKNTIALYATAACVQEAFVGPILVTFYTGCLGLSFSQMANFFSYIMIARLILEIPCGIYADMHNRKLTLIAGEILRLCAMALVLYFEFNKNLYYVIATAIIWGAGIALSSGNIIPILRDQLKSNNEIKFIRLINTRRTLSSAVYLFATIASGYIADLDLTYPFKLDILMTLLYIYLCLRYFDSIDDGCAGDGFLNRLREKIIKVKYNVLNIKFEILLSAGLVNGVMFACDRSAFNFLQSQLTLSDIEIKMWGWLISSVFLASAGVSFVFGKVLRNKCLMGQILLLSMLLSTLSSLILYFHEGPYYSVLYLGLSSSISVLLQPVLISSVLNEALEQSDSKSTAFSIMAFMSTLLAAFAQMLTGAMSSSFEAGEIVWACSLCGTISLLFFALWHSIRRSAINAI